MTPEQYRLTVDANTHIDRAISMLKDTGFPTLNVAGYNGVVSLLQYAKESHEYQISDLEKRLKELSKTIGDII